MAKKPIEERICELMFAKLASVNTANGFNYDLNAERIKAPENKKRHLTAIQVDTEPGAPLTGSSGGYTTVDKDIAIEVYFSPDSNDDTPLGTYISLVHSDIVTAFMDDYQWSGLAINTTPQTPSILSNDDGAIIGIAVEFTVRFRYRTNNPTQQ